MPARMLLQRLPYRPVRAVCADPSRMSAAGWHILHVDH